MGKELSHIICAAQAARLLSGSGSNGLSSLLHDHSREYHFGSIAADTFFYAVRFPGEPARPFCCGDLIHGADGNDTSEPIHGMLKSLRDAPNDPLFREKAAFVCGFLTHVALDSILHPYVYHVSGNYYDPCHLARRDAQVRHRLIEAWFDLHLLREASLNLAGCTFLSEIRRNGAINRELLRFFFAACEKTFPLPPASWHDLERGYRVQMLLNVAFKNAGFGRLVRHADRILAGRLSSFLALFYPGENQQVPEELIDFTSFRHPVTGETKGGGFITLWKQSVQRSAEFVTAADGFLSKGCDDDMLRDVIRGYSLSTGLVGVPIRDAVHYECIPLERLWHNGKLARQVSAR